VVTAQPGVVVLVRFPFSDLSSSKLRPAVVLAHAGGVDWILCQVTSNPYGDSTAVPLIGTSFAFGTSDARASPGRASSSRRASRCSSSRLVT
jgi:mRNA interferase MazF